MAKINLGHSSGQVAMMNAERCDNKVMRINYFTTNVTIIIIMPKCKIVYDPTHARYGYVW